MKLKMFALSLISLSVLNALAPEARADNSLGQFHVNSFAYQAWKFPINSCEYGGRRFLAIRLRAQGTLKANAAGVAFSDGGSQIAVFEKDTFRNEVIAEIRFQRPRCVVGVLLNARGESIVHVSGDEAGGGFHFSGPRPPHHGRPGRPGWDLPPPPPAPAPELHAIEVVFSSQERCRDLRQSVLVRRNDAEQAQLCTAAAGLAGTRIMRTALVKFNDGSSRCENFTDGDLASVCLPFMRTVR